MPKSATCSRLLLAGLFACASVPSRVVAQTNSATLSGHVTDRSTGKAIPKARVALLDQTRAVYTDSTGSYVLRELPSGPTQFVVGAPGYPDLHIIVELLEGQSRDRPVMLDSTAFGRMAAAQALPQVSVTERAPAQNYRLVAFEERRRTGRGQYLTEEQIDQTGAYNLSDAVRTLRGIIYECGGPELGERACYVRMSRAPMRCRPEIVIDEQTDNDFGLSTPIRDIVAIEVYTGPADVPGEFAGRNAGCGVIVVWTRAGPARSKAATGKPNPAPAPATTASRPPAA